MLHYQGSWEELPGASWNAADGRSTIQVLHFSGVLVTPTAAYLPVPPAGVYTFAISPDYTREQAAAIRETILAGPLAPFYACAGGFTFNEIPWSIPAPSAPTANITILRLDVHPGRPHLSSFIWSPFFTHANQIVLDMAPDTKKPIPPYTGTGTVPSDAYDLRTVIAHELSHFMSIPSQGCKMDPNGKSICYDPGGLFSDFIPTGVRRGMNATDKQAMAERFPRCDRPKVSISATPAQPLPNQDITVSWSLQNYAESCTASGDWSGSQPISGRAVFPAGQFAGYKVYTLECSGPTGSGIATTAAFVTPVSCPIVEGSWKVMGTAMQTCTGSLEGQSFRNDQPTTPSATLYQKVCAISSEPNFEPGFTSTVTGFVISDPKNTLFDVSAFLPKVAMFTRNQATTKGVIAPTLTQIDFTSSGVAEGTLDGVPGSCTFTSGITFTR